MMMMMMMMMRGKGKGTMTMMGLLLIRYSKLHRKIRIPYFCSVRLRRVSAVFRILITGFALIVLSRSICFKIVYIILRRVEELSMNERCWPSPQLQRGH